MQQPSEINRPTPPPVPKERDHWVLASILLLFGFLVYGFLSQGMLEVIGYQDFDLHPGFARDSNFERFYYFGYLILIPLALLSDHYMDRRESMAIGAILGFVGFLGFLLDKGWMIYPSMALIIIGNGLTGLALLGYFGGRWKGRRLKKNAGYLLAIGSMGLGGAFAQLFFGDRWEYGNLPYFFKGGLVLCFLLSVLLIIGQRRGKWFTGEKMPVNWITWRSLGYTLLFFFLVLSAVFFFALDIIDWRSSKEGRNLYLAALAVLVFSVVLLFNSGHFPKRQKISLALLMLGTYLLGYGQIGVGEFMKAGFYVGEGTFDWILPYQSVSHLAMAAGGIGLALVWLLRKKPGNGDLYPLFVIVAGSVLMVVCPWIMNWFNGETGYNREVWVVVAILYQMVYGALMGTIFFQVWQYSPIRLRMVAIAIILSATYFTEHFFRVQSWLKGADAYYGNYEMGNQGVPLVSLIGILVLGGLVLYRIRKVE